MKQYYFFFFFAFILTFQNAKSQTWWAQNSQTKADLNEIFYPTNNTGWAFGDSLDGLGGFASGLVIKSVTQGVPWAKQSMGTPVYQIEGSFFFNTMQGIVVGRNKLSGNGAIVATIDGGSTWTAAPAQKERLVDIHFANQNTGWTVGRNDFVLRTNDGGNSWTDISANTKDHLNGVFFTTSSNGYVVGKAGNIIHSIDSGSTWLTQTSGTGQDLKAVYFVNDSTGWTVGKAGIILFTNNYGKNWKPQTSGTNEDLLDVAFVNDTTGWTVGTKGTVLKTTDAGTTWNSETSGTQEDITSISMRSTTLGWFCGKNGVIHVYSVSKPNNVQEVTNSSRIAVYPNPVSEGFTIQLPGNGNWTIRLHDIAGRVVYTNHLLNQNKARITRQDWISGLYFVQVLAENGKSFQTQIVIE